MRGSEIRVKRIHVNQGLGVPYYNKKCSVDNKIELVFVVKWLSL